MSNAKNTEIQLGFITCPSCKYDGWKSAKLVVMEGTTNTTGSFEGVITDPGAFSGGLRNFLLSDRWFSWDQPIEANIGLTTSTGLVEEIKRLMVSHSSKTQMPKIPVKPREIGLFERVRPIEPKKPTAEPPVPSKPSQPIDLPWYKHFFESMRGALIIAIVVGFVFNPSAGIVLFIVSIPICFIASFMANKANNDEYEKKLRLYPEEVKLSIEQHQRDCLQYERDLLEYELERSKADLQKREEEQAISLYKKQIEEFEIKESNLIKERELLWERARVCTRCGTAFLSV